MNKNLDSCSRHIVLNLDGASSELICILKLSNLAEITLDYSLINLPQCSLAMFKVIFIY